MSLVWKNIYLAKWKACLITAEELHTKVPDKITEAEYQEIITTPQNPDIIKPLSATATEAE